MKVHPVAEIFPMMNDAELKDLAADIKANGLLNPITTEDDEKTLVDGRNRLAACKIAGIEPVFQKLNGHDPVAFILSSNIARRHMTKGQQAMAVARIYPEAMTKAQAGSRKGKSSLKIKELHLVNPGLLSQARTVLKHLPEVAKKVLSGETTLSNGYEQAQQASEVVGSIEKQLERLQKEAPDLAQLVTEERMKTTEAIAALEKRIEDEKQRRQLVTKQFAELINAADYGEGPTKEWAEKVAIDIDLDEWPRYANEKDFSTEPIKRSIEFLSHFIKTWERNHGRRRSKKTHR